MNTLGIIIACGKEEEITSGTDSAFLSMGEGPVISHSLRRYQASDAIDGIIVVVAKERVEATLQLAKRFGCYKVCGIVVGSVGRLSSLRTVMSKLPEPAATVVIQEASRPFVSKTTIEEVVKGAKRYGCAIAAHRLPDAIKLATKGLKPDSVAERNTAWATQTPQAFRFEVLEKILDPKNKATKLIDDESAFVKKPAEVHMIEASGKNMKIRTSDDLAVATALQGAGLVSGEF